MNIAEYLDDTNFKSRHQLSCETGLVDRAVRQKISDLKMNVPVIYNSQTKGYRLGKKLDTLSLEELEHERLMTQHCLNDIESRKEVFNQQERTYIAYKYQIERFMHQRLLEKLNG